MATAAQKLSDHCLSCIICTDLYKDPCTLTCGHTFCRECLTTFTKTQQDAVKLKSIICPNCRQMKKVTNPGEHAEDWLKDIKPSLIIRRLIDDRQHENQNPDNLCFHCQQNNEETPASFHCKDCDLSMCDKCVKMHRTKSAFSNHTVSELEAEEKLVKQTKVRCKTHSNIIELCCKNCSKVICQKCCINNHSKCADIVPLKSMVPEMIANLRQYKDALTEQEQKMQHDVKKKKKQIEDAEAKKTRVESDVTRVAEKAIGLVKLKERDLLHAVQYTTERHVANIAGQVKAEEADIQMCQQHCEFIDQVLASESEVDMYDMSVSQTGAIKTDEGKDLGDSSTIGEVVFSELFQKEMITRNVQLGNVEILKNEIGRKSTPTLADTLDITPETDENPFDPVDVTIKGINRIDAVVVTDFSNKCLRSFYTADNQSHHCRLDLAGEPWTVTNLRYNQVAVAFYSGGRIVIARVTPDLILASIIYLQRRYHCLTSLNDSTLVIGCYGVLHIIDLTGIILKTLRPGVKISPNFLCTTKDGNVLVTDNKSQSVYCLTQDGDIVFNYNPSGDKAFGIPRGITVSQTGDIFVVDYSHHKVVQLTPSGEFVRDVLTAKDGINNPYGICLHGNKLYVAQNQQSLMVFRFQP